jgi:hypothetical protein
VRRSPTKTVVPAAVGSAGCEMRVDVSRIAMSSPLTRSVLMSLPGVVRMSATYATLEMPCVTSSCGTT